MSTRSYIVGYSISKDDSATLSALPAGNVAGFKHVSRWAKHIAALTGVAVVASSSSSGAGSAPGWKQMHESYYYIFLTYCYY